MEKKPTYQELEQQILELKKNREEFEGSQALLRLMMDNVPDMIWAKDIDDKYIFANQSICDNLLHSESTLEPEGKTDLFFAQRERQRGYTHTFGEICINSDQVVKKNNCPGRFLEDGMVRGEYLALDVHKAPFYDPSGKMIGTVGCGRDVTKERQIYKALEVSEKRFRELIEDVSEISIQGYDENRKVTFWNQASEKLYGYTEAQALGKKLEDLIIPDAMKDEVIRLHNQWVEQNIKIPPDELLLVDKDGRDVPVFSSHVMLETPHGKEMYCIDVDLTPIKQSEAEKEQLQHQLRQSQKMEAVGTLAGGIAHDFNNILFSIGGFSELLLDDLEPGSRENENILEIISAVKRGSELVNQILSFSRRSEQKKGPVLFQKILKEVIKLCRSTIPSNLEIQQKIQNNIGYIAADPIQLHQVAMNLITNAFQSLDPNKGKICVELTQVEKVEGDNEMPALEPGSYALLKVADTGGGMAPEILDKIFEPYFTTKTNKKGTGLGLATVYGIIMDHRGEISVQSSPGKGSTFKVYLPITESPEPAVHIKKEKQSPTGSERILLVDDEPAIAIIEKRLLSRLGYQVTDHISSPDALARFKDAPHDFDLVITDMAMPGLTGAELTRAILAIRQDIPIIICSGFSDPLDQKQAEALGVKGFLAKPVTGSQMGEMIRKVLDQVN